MRVHLKLYFSYPKHQLFVRQHKQNAISVTKFPLFVNITQKTNVFKMKIWSQTSLIIALLINMQISSNVVGKIGEKLAVTFNFDNNNTFDFQNDMKVDYTGFDEEIIKKIEVGNVSMPVSNSLIAGAQSLFGVKTQLQFGRLYITGIASRQRGRNEVLNIENGVDAQQFELRASDYDENRHFFLGHFFRDNYGILPGQWLSNLPQVTSGVNITRLEVYVVNRNNETSETRNFLALADLGESRRINNPSLTPNASIRPTSNEGNDLYARIRNNEA